MTTELERLKTWMQENDIEAHELARKVGVTYQVVYRILAGLRPAQEKFKQAFARKYGWDAAVDIFIQREGESRPPIYEAHRAVARAIKEGDLLPASAYKCAACDKSAQSLHHTSYHPDDFLCVTPLCNRCHRLADRNKLDSPLGVLPTSVGLVRIAISHHPTPTPS